MSKKKVLRNLGPDNLSDYCGCEIDAEGLDLLVESLDSDQIEEECKLRKQLVANQKKLRADRYEQGQILEQYRNWYRKEGLWGAFCKAVRINERTAHRLIEDYHVAAGVAKPVRQAAAKRGVDLAAKKNRALASELTKSVPAANELTDKQAKHVLEQAQAKIKTKPTPASLSREERVDKACKQMYRLYDSVSQEERIEEIEAIHQSVCCYYSISLNGRVPGPSLAGLRRPASVPATFFEQQSLLPFAGSGVA